MTIDRTQTQHGDEHHRARRLSLDHSRPPTDVPGYEIQRFLGAGAYGQVWVAIDRNTGRHVAIKFYEHSGGLDWSLLSREVEKLVFLSADRYVVQLLDVGWEAQPPYYVMEYMEQGSLDDRLRTLGTLPAAEAVAVCRDVATGLMHAHQRGVLHCDLKPANVLLDQDNRPRLADFGQSRLSHEQDPALGTLFYMAPEQADLKAVPDVRWDVYALGALLYALLTGAPPHRTDATTTEIEQAEDLQQRLANYRRVIREAPLPTGHRQVRGVDRSLAEIIERCLDPDPERRMASPQAIIDELDEREARRAKLPLVTLGLVGPLLFLIIMFAASKGALDTVVAQSDEALTRRVLESNRFAAQARAQSVRYELERRFRVVQRMADDDVLPSLMTDLASNPETAQLIDRLNDPAISPEEHARLRRQFLAHPLRNELQQRLEKLSGDDRHPLVASWFVTGPDGLQYARQPVSDTIGRNYGWRTYFHGQAEDRPEDWRPGEGEHVEGTHLSAVFRSQASQRWIAGISTPVITEKDGRFLGIVALTVELGRFVTDASGNGSSSGHAGANPTSVPQPLDVLVDWRDGPNKGVILQHPKLERLLADPDRHSDPLHDYRIGADAFVLSADGTGRHDAFEDPLVVDEQGRPIGPWLAVIESVRLRGEPSGLVVIVQETPGHAIGPTLDRLSDSLFRIGLIASVSVAAVTAVLWAFVVGRFRRARSVPVRSGNDVSIADAPPTLIDRRTGPDAQPTKT